MPANSTDDLDIAKTLADIAKGETTASALEAHLNALEGKVDELLAIFDSQSSPREDVITRNQKQNKERGVEVKPERRP
ncbi:uncharacterized protein N7498_008592 [Penicillium cinerascens]|uniref:Uncharacterized protein n=1 Tax=Penicillium cinerascens TaxID=70096 RepID=A0A9W9JEZ9_9EURO|nr:uncharacterized protein N7498_008592 [Penicillium cinerascens]KAJ5195154.1 hypothetical protein N7498_008592 [Penicillium cinerascens]